ncbi:MAG: hypothetical protein GY715_12740 [Planctomycetes bacterium]|nr:hypothetical protein [Planctomycetota bacterium]
MTYPYRLAVLALTAALSQSPIVHAGQIETRGALDAILSGSEEYLEDFEHVSFHAGTSIPVPNPFNHITGAPLWADLLPGATYSSSGDLFMLAGYLHGDDSNILRGEGDVTIAFDEPQLAIGFDIDGGNVELHQVLTFYRDGTVIDTWEFDMAPSATVFAGWQNPVGITSVLITTTPGNNLTEIDNIGWGVVVLNPCPADVNDSGAVDFADILELIGNWGRCEKCAADINADGTVNFGDILAVIAAWGPCAF